MSTSPVPPAVAVDPSAIDGSFVGERSPLAHTAEIDGEAVVLDEESDRLHLLNHTAALVWHCLDGTSRLDAICADLAHELGGPVDRVLAETVLVVRDLVVEGLVTPSAGWPR